MAAAPLLQVRRMLQRVGVASKDIALVTPNVVAFIVAAGTVLCALHLRTARRSASRDVGDMSDQRGRTTESAVVD
jgi:hypothetical protein